MVRRRGTEALPPYHASVVTTVPSLTYVFTYVNTGEEVLVRKSFRSRKVVGTTTKLTRGDWSKIFAHKWSEEYRLALEAIRDNGNEPTSIEQFREKAPDFYVGRRDGINNTLRRIGSPFFVTNVNRGLKDAHLQVLRR